MRYDKKDRLLIISNNVLSNNRNNGKTVYSYIDGLPYKNVRQLYFNSEMPSISGYDYFQISDIDILKGLFLKKYRGRKVEYIEEKIEQKETEQEIIAPPKNCLTRIIREIVWCNKWKSKQLEEWLKEFNPTAVFFVGGDSIFAYKICSYITKKFSARLTLYITDDYIMPRKDEKFFSKRRRETIKKNMKEILELADAFFTVSHPMQKEYKKIFHRDSNVIVNMTESLKDEKYQENIDRIDMIYAGSLYYGRDDVCGKIASVIKKYNESALKKVFFKIYTNSVPSIESRKKFECENVCKYCGSLNQKELIAELNRSSILVFVESFEKNYIEKTRYSLSTKVPEYLSVGKPILAVGPKGIGSMDYLEDCSLCINSLENLEEGINQLFLSEKLRENLSLIAEKKYKLFHNKKDLQEQFLKTVLGI